MISKLCLGTAQLGLESYGIANRTGKPPRDVAFEILDRAIASGVPWIDTAAAYGDAEEILGEYGVPSRVKIATKLRPGALDGMTDRKKIIDAVNRGIDEAVSRLHRRPDVFLFHTAKDILRREVREAVARFWDRPGGPLPRFGPSCYTPEQVAASYNPNMFVVQAPYSAVDRRCEAAMARVKMRGITVFARSPFCQGLLVLDESEWPASVGDALTAWLPVVGTPVAKAGPKIALAFALANPYADYVVFGCETVEQLEEDLEIARRCDRKAWEFIRQVVPAESAIVNPSLWAK